MTRQTPRWGWDVYRLGAGVVAVLVFGACSFAWAEQPATLAPSPPTAPRQPDAMPQPPTPSPTPERPQPPSMMGQPPGYWRSPEAVRPWRDPYQPGFYPQQGYYRWDFQAPPTLRRPRYRAFWNRSGGLPRRGYRWYGTPWWP